MHPPSAARHTEANTVEAMITDACSRVGWKPTPSGSLPRQTHEVFVEPMVRNALVHLNPEIRQQPDRADEVLYRLRAIPLSVRTDGLVRANENLTAWLRGEKSMPFGENNDHTPVRLIDFDNPANNTLTV